MLETKSKKTKNYRDYLMDYEVPPYNYTKAQLEHLYSNGGSPMTPDMRRECENTALFNNKTMIEALVETGYKKGKNYYTKKQVEIFFAAVSPPTLTDANIDYLCDDVMMLSPQQANILKALFSQKDDL